MVCDFCSAPCPSYRYPARSFVYDSNPDSAFLNASKGDWAACAVCHEMIERGDYNGLAGHSTSTFLDIHPEMAPAKNAIREHMRKLHSKFREARTGPPTRIDN